jgi:hypothetical protein
MSWHTLVAGCALLAGSAACTRPKAPPQEAPATRLPEKLSMNEPWDWNGVIGTGQSLAVGVEGLPLRATQPSYRNLKLDLGGASFPQTKDTSERLSLAPLCEPIRPFASGYPAPFPHNIYGETPHTCMASQITALALAASGGKGDYVSVHSVVGESGQPLRVLAKGAVPVDDTGRAYAASLFEVRALTRLARQAKRSFGVAAIVLTHGEADAENPDYEQGLLRLWRDYDVDLAAVTGQRRKPLLLLTQQSAVPTRPGTLATSALAALGASRAEPEHIVCVGPRYQYEYAPDAVHLQSIGYDRLGEKYGQVFFERSVLGHDWQPLAATSVERQPGVVSIGFHVPVPPLVWDETLPAALPAGHVWANGRGFELLADGVAARIESVEIEGARVNLRTAASGRLVVRYAATASLEPRAHGSWRWGQLRDSDPFVGATTRTPQPNHAVTFELQVP